MRRLLLSDAELREHALSTLAESGDQGLTKTQWIEETLRRAGRKPNVKDKRMRGITESLLDEGVVEQEKKIVASGHAAVVCRLVGSVADQPAAPSTADEPLAPQNTPLSLAHPLDRLVEYVAFFGTTMTHLATMLEENLRELRERLKTLEASLAGVKDDMQASQREAREVLQGLPGEWCTALQATETVIVTQIAALMKQQSKSPDANVLAAIEARLAVNEESFTQLEEARKAIMAIFPKSFENSC